MKVLFIVLLFMAAVLVTPAPSRAVTDEDFHVNTTRNLINLCSAPASDPLQKEAVHFCEGYLVGAYAYYDATHQDTKDARMVCLPEPVPSRDKATAMFVEWANAHPQYMGEKPVETMFRFLEATWPCKR